VEIHDVARLAGALAGVRRTEREGLAEWRYHGRLVARQLDDVHVVIRAGFDYRDAIVRQFPGTFSVPDRYIKHMMVVADLASGDSAAIEDALEAAWQLQRSSGLRCQAARGVFAVLDPEDIARVAVAALTDDGHAGRTSPEYPRYVP
jgi:hypothetical protein